MGSKRTVPKIRGMGLYGWRYGAFLGALVAGLGLALYPVTVQPYRQSAEWREIQTDTREQIGVAREDRQPGGMKVWNDPFGRK